MLLFHIGWWQELFHFATLFVLFRSAVTYFKGPDYRHLCICAGQFDYVNCKWAWNTSISRCSLTLYRVQPYLLPLCCYQLYKHLILPNSLNLECAISEWRQYLGQMCLCFHTLHHFHPMEAKRLLKFLYPLTSSV